MPIVSFTLTDEGVASFQNALACILKFSEDVSLAAWRDKIVLSTLNAIQSAFVSFTFSASHFTRYKYEGSERSPDSFQCLILIRALLSIFRSRTGGDAGRGGSGDSSIERCDVSIEDGPNRKSRFVAKIAWRNGITATHAISFEAKSSVSAKFNSSQADNQWSISAHTLRRLMDHFGPKVELLDINTEGEGVLNLTCSTEKQYTKTDGILNMNLHTSIAVKMDDFDDIDVEDKHHIIINAAPRLSNRAEPKPSQAAALPSTARTAPIAPTVNSGFEMRPPLAPPSTIRVEALYDEDSQWEPVNPEEDNSGFVQIEWDESLRPQTPKTIKMMNQRPRMRLVGWSQRNGLHR
ncbi:hypothetical protein SBRCBS47491_002878 [Sporothrix bragantina]|uniref:DNA repair protein rad9 n=1 Tax=Sporothrix bragantina TaxID=671064 RepID=A0ABP0BAU0_9PEZI